MSKILRALAALTLLWGVQPAEANFTITQGAGTTIVAVDATNQGTSLCAAGSTECWSTVLMDTTGTVLSTTSHVLNVNSTILNASIPVTGTFFQATQPVSLLSLPPLATGANVIGSISNSSFGISGTLPAFAATPTVNIGTMPSIPTGGNTIGAISNTSFGISGTLPAFATTPSFNLSQWGGGIITSTPTAVGTVGTGNTPTINAYIVGGGGAGGTSSSFGSAFPAIGTAAGAEFLTSPPTLTTGQMVPFLTDVNGNLKVNVAAGAASGGTSSNFNATFPTAGTAAGAEFLSAPPTLTTGQMVPFQTDVNGNLKVNIAVGAAGGTSSAFGSAFPATGTAIGLTNGTNMVAWSASSNYGTAPSAIAVPAVNAAITQSALPTGAATAANQIPLTAAGTTATTAGAVQGVAGGIALATNLASWGGTAVTNVPTNVGTAGTGTTPTFNAYIVGGGGAGGTSSTFGAAFPSLGTAAGAEYLSTPPTLTSGNMAALQSDVNGNLKTTASTFLTGGTYLNVNAVTTSANSVLPAGPAIIVYNYGVVKALVKLSTSGSTTVTATTADAIVGPGGAVQLATGTNTNIAYATTSQSAALQIVGGSGQWNGSVSNNLSISQYNLSGAIPSYATLIAGADTGNLMQVPSVNVAGTSGTEAFAVQGVAGGVPQASNINQWGSTAFTNVPTAVGTVGTGTTPTINAYIVGGAGSGGTALADNAAWTAGTTNFTPSGCEFTTGGATSITTAHAATVGCTAARAFFTDKSSVAGTALTAAVSALGTAATGTAVENVNTFIVGCVSTTCNANVTNAGTITASAASASPVTNFNYVLNGTSWLQMAGDSSGRAIMQSASQYPVTAVPITASATGTTAATTATLTNVAGHTTYICGYSIRANATAATTVVDTVTGVITATMSSELWVSPNSSGLGVDEQIFMPCIPASAVSTSIAVVSGAPGTGGLVSVKAWGYSI